MSSVPNTIRTMALVDRIFDRDLEAEDAASEAAYERIEAAEQSVTFDDVIEEVADFNPARKQVFMEALESGDHYTCWLLCDQARDRLIERKLGEQS